MADEPDKKIVSDSDWKQQARKEKERLAQKQADDQAASSASSDAKADPQHPGHGPMPPATFLVLVNSLAIQALYALGALGHNENEQPVLDLDIAKHHIDLLQILEDKTKGNLSEDEQKTLSLALHELRMRFVAVSRAMQQ